MISWEKLRLMKLVSYKDGGSNPAALLVNGNLFDIGDLMDDAPATMLALLREWERCYHALVQEERQLLAGVSGLKSRSLEHVELLAPVPSPTSVRDAYAFRQHVEMARRN